MDDWWLMLLGSWAEILYPISARHNSLKVHISRWSLRKVSKDGAVCVVVGIMVMLIPFISPYSQMYLSR